MKQRILFFSLLLLGAGCVSTPSTPDVSNLRTIQAFGYSIDVREDWYAEFDSPNQDHLLIQNYPYPSTDIEEFSDDAFWIEISFNAEKPLTEFRSDFASCADVTLGGASAIRCTGRRGTTPDMWQEIGYYVDGLKPTLIRLSAQEDPGPGISLAESTVQTIQWEPEM